MSNEFFDKAILLSAKKMGSSLVDFATNQESGSEHFDFFAKYKKDNYYLYLTSYFSKSERNHLEVMNSIIIARDFDLRMTHTKPHFFLDLIKRQVAGKINLSQKRLIEFTDEAFNIFCIDLRDKFRRADKFLLDFENIDLTGLMKHYGLVIYE